MGNTIKPAPRPGQRTPGKPPRGGQPLPPKTTGTTKPTARRPQATSTFERRPAAAPGNRQVIGSPPGRRPSPAAGAPTPNPAPAGRQVVIGSLLPGLKVLTPEEVQRLTDPPCPAPPTAADNSREVPRLWSALHVEEAHRLLADRGVDCWTVGSQFTVAIVDADPTGHGAYTATLATGDVDAPWGQGTLTGIAPGASAAGMTFVRQPGLFLEPALWALTQPQSYVDNEVSRGFTTTFANAAAAAGSTGVVAFTNPAPRTMSEAEALDFLAQVRGYVAQGGVVVLPGNLFGAVGAAEAVRRALAESGALVAQPVIDGAVPDAAHGQPPSSTVNVAVPTTNGNNSVAVPAIAAVAVLVREANPSLSSAQVTQLLTDPANFDTVVVDARVVPVLDAARAVEEATAPSQTGGNGRP
ncbi:MAG: hypothetical protein IT380_29985 [Myxococcales bacterium]|nr:hypothetical protein [Myxococcales bacterium]